MWLAWTMVAFGYDASDCGGGGGGFAPIAGTSGLNNARSALTTNRQIYGAASFAERHLFQQTAEGADGDLVVKGGYEFGNTHGAARVPVYVPDAGADIGTDGCPPELAIALSPLDLASMAGGFGIRSKGFGVFYAASVTMGQTATPNDYVRFLIWDLAQPMYMIPGLIAAPLTGPGFYTSSGASAYAIEWVGGVDGDLGFAHVRAGYAGVAKGFYVQGEDTLVGLFATSAIDPGQDRLDPLSMLKGGIDRFDLRSFGEEEVGEKVGATSAFYRDLPFGAEARTEEGVGISSRFRTGHVYQEDVLRMFDVRFAYALSPAPLVHEATFGVHSPGFYRRREPVASDELRGGVGVKVGMTELPDVYTLGVAGGRYVSVRAEAGASGNTDFGLVDVRCSFLYNDPEQLALYPFARNAGTLHCGGGLSWSK